MNYAYAAMFILLFVFPAAAQTPPPDDPMTKVRALQKKIADYQEMMKSDDSNLHGAAIEQALAENSPAIRDAAISASLTRFSNLNPKRFSTYWVYYRTW